MDQDVCLCSHCKPQPQEFFDAKMRAIADDDTDAAAIRPANGTERYLVSPIAYLNNAYLKWLIYSAAFNEPFAEPEEQCVYNLYLHWTKTFQCWQGRHFPPEAVRGTGDLVCQVPCIQDAWL